MVRNWVRKFSEGRDNVHKLCNDQPSVVTDDLVCAVKAKVREDRQFNILSLSLHFQQISRTVL
jgi:hypothetical protein